jgi:hypothetical protein
MSDTEKIERVLRIIGTSITLYKLLRRYWRWFNEELAKRRDECN